MIVVLVVVVESYCSVDLVLVLVEVVVDFQVFVLKAESVAEVAWFFV